MVARGVLFLSCLVFVVVGCSDWFTSTPFDEPTIYEPNTVGEVADVTSSGGTLLVTLKDGRTVEIDPRTAMNLEGGAEPQPGSLLVLGRADGDVWFDVLFALSDPPVKPCWNVPDFGQEDGGAIRFDYGLRLPKGAGFDGSLGDNGRYSNPNHAFCLNGRGEVTAYR